MTSCRAQCRRPPPLKRPGRQRGQVLLLLLLFLVTGAAYLLLQSLSAASIATERDRITQQALAEAKAALIAYAVNDANRPGSLPCPDANDDGWAKVPEDYSGINCRVLIGRLPWRTLGIGDLRDGHGERLWYALSHDFRASGIVALNSGVKGDLTIVGAAPLNDVIAILLSPGSVLVREGGTTPQERSGGSGPCSGPMPYTSTPKCNPVNYLDTTLGEDNADGNSAFVTATPTGSFNDLLLALTHDALFTAVNKRVAAAIRGATTPGSGVQGYYEAYSRYPWAGDGTGHQVPGSETGAVPYQDLSIESKDDLIKNGWFDPAITVYTVSPDQSRATITTGSPATKICLQSGLVTQCP